MGSASESKHQMKSGLLLDVVVSESTTVLKLLASEDQALLVRRDAFLVLNLLLHALDRVRGLDIEGDGLAGEGLDEDLHATAASKTKHEVESGLLLDVVVSESTTVLKLLASEDQTLLVRRDAFLEY
jgi:hypothetical protein